MNPGRAFAGVGTAFGAAFVFINAGGLPSPWDLIAAVGCVPLVMLAIWRGVVRAPPDQRSGTSVRAYWSAVAAEILAIPAGAFVLDHLDRPHLVVLWVVFVVGAHFLPARAFGPRRFAGLGWALMAVAIAFAAAQLATGSTWVPSAGAVAAGAVLLVFVATSAGGQQRPTTEMPETAG